MAVTLGAVPAAEAVRLLERRLDEPLRPIPAGVRVETRVTTYQLDARSIRDAQAVIGQQGRADADGRRWAGYTRWRLRWNYEYERATSCQFKTLTVAVSLEVDLPVLSDSARADAATRLWYESWFDRLFHHEVGHAKLARDGAREIYQRLRFLQGSACDELGNRANQIGRQLLDDLNERQRRYDAETAHGARPVPPTS